MRPDQAKNNDKVFIILRVLECGHYVDEAYGGVSFAHIEVWFTNAILNKQESRYCKECLELQNVIEKKLLDLGERIGFKIRHKVREDNVKTPIKINTMNEYGEFVLVGTSMG